MKRSRSDIDWALGLDLMEMVLLSHVGMDLQSFVRVGLVCKAWRSVCRSSPILLVNVAARSELRTILVCMRLFALSMDEAKRFAMIRGVPRESGESGLFFGSVEIHGRIDGVA